MRLLLLPLLLVGCPAEETPATTPTPPTTTTTKELPAFDAKKSLALPDAGPTLFDPNCGKPEQVKCTR